MGGGVPVLVLLGLAVIAFAVAREVLQRLKTRERAPRPVRRPLVEKLGDPREAAAVLMVRMALLSGRLTSDEKEVILSLMRGVFGASDEEAEGLFSFGRAAAGQTDDDAPSVRRLLRPVHDRCTLPEMKDLAAMLEQVGETGGPMNEAQRALLATVRKALRLGEPVELPPEN
jgi:uncharacterized tellurite resistance protein B-like protein